MADPLSIAASIAGILSLAGAVIHKTYRYGSDVRGAPEDMASFLRELTITTGLLAALKTLAESDAQTASHNLTRNGSLVEISGRNGALEACKRTLESISREMDEHDGRPAPNKRQMVDRLTGRLKWPFQKERTKDLVEQLGRQKGAFTLALSIDNSWVSLNDLDASTGKLIFSRNSLRELHDGFASFIRQDEERRRGERPTWLAVCSTSMNTVH
jgi:hypothetical protein